MFGPKMFGPNFFFQIFSLPYNFSRNTKKNFLAQTSLAQMFRGKISFSQISLSQKYSGSEVFGPNVKQPNYQGVSAFKDDYKDIDILGWPRVFRKDVGSK